MCGDPEKLRYLFCCCPKHTTNVCCCFSIRIIGSIMIIFELISFGILAFYSSDWQYKAVTITFLVLKFLYLCFFLYSVCNSKYQFVHVAWVLDTLVTLIILVIGFTMFINLIINHSKIVKEYSDSLILYGKLIGIAGSVLFNQYDQAVNDFSIRLNAIKICIIFYILFTMITNYFIFSLTKTIGMENNKFMQENLLQNKSYELSENKI